MSTLLKLIYELEDGRKSPPGIRMLELAKNLGVGATAVQDGLDLIRARLGAGAVVVNTSPGVPYYSLGKPYPEVTAAFSPPEHFSPL